VVRPLRPETITAIQAMRLRELGDLRPRLLGITKGTAGYFRDKEAVKRTCLS